MANTDERAQCEISGMAIEGQMVLLDCVTVDGAETRDQAEILQLAADLEAEADVQKAIAAKLRALVAREIARDVERENLNHTKALNLFRGIATKSEQTIKANKQEALALRR